MQAQRRGRHRRPTARVLPWATAVTLAGLAAAGAVGVVELVGSVGNEPASDDAPAATRPTDRAPEREVGEPDPGRRRVAKPAGAEQEGSRSSTPVMARTAEPAAEGTPPAPVAPDPSRQPASDDPAEAPSPEPTPAPEEEPTDQPTDQPSDDPTGDDDDPLIPLLPSNPPEDPQDRSSRSWEVRAPASWPRTRRSDHTKIR